MKWHFAGMLGAALVLAGCSHDQAGQGNNAAVPAEEKPGGVISSIKDAMNLGRAMECTYTDPNMKGEASVIHTQGNKFKSTSRLEDGSSSYAMSDGETIYIWSDKDKNGVKMTQGCLDEFEQSVPEGQAPPEQTVEDPEDTFDTAENVVCKEAGAVDLFVPKDINFVDQCELMKQSMQLMQQAPQMNSADMQKMMEQYQQQ